MPKSSPDNNQPESQKPNQGPSRWQQMKDAAAAKWEGRPSWFEVQYYYLPLGLAVGGMAVATVDDVFELGLAQDMANVRTEPQDGMFEGMFEDVVRQIGQNALELENNVGDK